MTDHCIIHVGTHKTGSTSIQDTLFRELSDPAFEYAKLGRPSHSTSFQHAFLASPESHISLRSRNLTDDEVLKICRRARLKIKRAVSEAAAPTVIFSGEGIILLDEAELERMRDFIKRRVAKISVVCYVRAPQGYMQSAYQERIKSHLCEIDFARLYTPYRHRLEKFDRVFGQDHVSFWKFAPNEFPGGDVVRHFCETLGISLPSQLRRMNNSLSKPVVQALYAFHKYKSGPGNPRLTSKQKNSLAAILSGVKGEKFRFASEAVAPVLAAYRDDIEWIEQRMGSQFVEPAGDDNGAVHNEEDMLRIDDASVASLEELVSASTDLPEHDLDPARYAAKLVKALLKSALPLRRKVQIYSNPAALESSSTE